MRSLSLWIVAFSAALGIGVLAAYLQIFLETGGFSTPRKLWAESMWLALTVLVAGELLIGLGFSRLPFLWGMQPLLLAFGAIVPILIVYDDVLAAERRANPQANILWPIAEAFIGGITFVAAAIGAYAGRGLAWVWLRKGGGSRNQARWQWLHLAITTSLAVAVAVLGVLLWRERRSASEPPTPGAAATSPAASRRIERVPDAEMVLKKFGYQAWVYRWQGGMIDGTVRFGPGFGETRSLNGEGVLDVLRSAVAKRGPVALTSVSGVLVVRVGPITRGEDKEMLSRNNLNAHVTSLLQGQSFAAAGCSSYFLTDPAGKRQPFGACIVYIEAKCEGGSFSEEWTADDMVPPVAFVAEASADELSVQVYGKYQWYYHQNKLLGGSADPNSKQTLLQLRWLEDADKAKAK